MWQHYQHPYWHSGAAVHCLEWAFIHLIQRTFEIAATGSQSLQPAADWSQPAQPSTTLRTIGQLSTANSRRDLLAEAKIRGRLIGCQKLKEERQVWSRKGEFILLGRAGYFSAAFLYARLHWPKKSITVYIPEVLKQFLLLHLWLFLNLQPYSLGLLDAPRHQTVLEIKMY